VRINFPSGWWQGRDVALGYAAVVCTTTLALAMVPDTVARRVIFSSSTNLVNLRSHPPFVLVVSAFVEPSVRELWIVVPMLWALGALQRWMGRAAVVISAGLGHVGATLAVSTVLAAGIARNRIAPAEQVATDVGISYGLVAVVGLLAARLTGVRRRWYVIGFTAFFVAAVFLGRSFTDLGHLFAWLLGLALAALVSRARRLGPEPAGEV
jgi:hypothetical protein